MQIATNWRKKVISSSFVVAKEGMQFYVIRWRVSWLEERKLSGDAI